MARGWESKAVEEQIAAAESDREVQAGRVLTEAERVARARRDGLLLSRAKIIGEMQAARDARHRALLERALAHLDRELALPGHSSDNA